MRQVSVRFAIPAVLALMVSACVVLVCLAQPPLRYPLPGPQPQLQSQPSPGFQQFPGNQLQPPREANQGPEGQVVAYSPTPPQPTLFAPGQIVARVGDKTILYGDVAPTVSMIMAPELAKAKSPAERDAIESQRPLVTRSIVQQAVQNKMLLIEFERGMPSEIRSDAKKRSEAEGKLRKNVRNAFDSSLRSAREKVENASAEEIEELLKQDSTMIRLALIMKERGLQSTGELDLALRQYGTTLEQQAKDYGEHMMGIEAVMSKLGTRGKNAKKFDVSHDEMLEYYNEHQADYQVPAKARFEILTARLSRFDGNHQAALDHIAMMGNEVLLGGTPFAAVARKHSHEPNAADGGAYDWVTPGSLASKPLDQAIFSVEVDKLSQIIADDQGYHIIRVTERRAAGMISFADEQPAIRKKIEDRKRDEERQKYLNELRGRTVIWTIYDPPAGAEPTRR